jgi:hypothetical protein
MRAKLDVGKDYGGKNEKIIANDFWENKKKYIV